MSTWEYYEVEFAYPDPAVQLEYRVSILDAEVEISAELVAVTRLAPL